MSLMGILEWMYYKMLVTQKKNHLLLCIELLLQVKGLGGQYGLYRLGKDLLYLWKFSVPEILLLLYPIVMMSAPAVVVPVIYILQNDSPQFLYSLCPQEYRSMSTLMLFAVPELWLICNWFSTCFHFGFVTAALLQKSIDICKEEMARLRWGTSKNPKKVVQRYRELLLQTQLYNFMAGGIVYMTKLLFMTMAILGFFITIRFGTELPVLMTAINVIMGVLGVFLYNSPTNQV